MLTCVPAVKPADLDERAAERDAAQLADLLADTVADHANQRGDFDVVAGATTLI